MIKLWKSFIAWAFPKKHKIDPSGIDHLNLEHLGKQELDANSFIQESLRGLEKEYVCQDPFEFVPLGTSVFKSTQEILAETRQEATLRREAYYAMIDTVEFLINDIEVFDFFRLIRSNPI